MNREFSIDGKSNKTYPLQKGSISHAGTFQTKGITRSTISKPMNSSTPSVAPSVPALVNDIFRGYMSKDDWMPEEDETEEEGNGNANGDLETVTANAPVNESITIHVHVPPPLKRRRLEFFWGAVKRWLRERCD